MFGPIHVTPIIARYTSQYPETSVNAIFKDEIVDFVEDNIDIAIRIGHLKDSSLMAKKVASLRWIVCGSPAYLEKNGIPETPNDLDTHKLVNLTVHDHRYNWEFKNAEKIRPKKDLVVNSILASKAAALADWGLIQALSYQVATEIEEGSLIPVLEDYATPPIPVHILQHNTCLPRHVMIQCYTENAAILVSASLQFHLVFGKILAARTSMKQAAPFCVTPLIRASLTLIWRIITGRPMAQPKRISAAF